MSQVALFVGAHGLFVAVCVAKRLLSQVGGIG